MSCPPIYWTAFNHTGPPFYASFNTAGIEPFAVVGQCVGEREGQYSIRITRKGRPDLWGYADSLEQAKRDVERWARRHWRTLTPD